MRIARLDIARAQHRPGFTLVEMLIVVGIIVILVTMLVPSLAAVRTAARVTSTQVLLHTLETGLNMFRGEIRLGRDYPPSYWDGAQGGVPPNYKGSEYYGAMTLVWALAGADLRGTPGFRLQGNESMADLYISTTTHARYGPFVDISKTRIGKAPADPDYSDVDWAAPVFVDDFNWPVLYFKAPYLVRDNEGILSKNQENQPPPYLTHTAVFTAYIQDPRASQLGLLLISVGPDKKYGTADDVANFPFNPVQ
jgi:prepilin-type N-terminal cleavage/methylation domain-containing protein